MKINNYGKREHLSNRVTTTPMKMMINLTEEFGPGQKDVQKNVYRLNMQNYALCIYPSLEQTTDTSTHFMTLTTKENLDHFGNKHKILTFFKL